MLLEIISCGGRCVESGRLESTRYDLCRRGRCVNGGVCDVSSWRSFLSVCRVGVFDRFGCIVCCRGVTCESCQGGCSGDCSPGIEFGSSRVHIVVVASCDRGRRDSERGRREVDTRPSPGDSARRDVRPDDQRYRRGRSADSGGGPSIGRGELVRREVPCRAGADVA